MSVGGILMHPTIRQIMVYEGLREDIERNHKGRRTLVANESLIGIYDTCEDTVIAATENDFPIEDYIVPWIGVENVILSFEAEDGQHSG